MTSSFQSSTKRRLVVEAKEEDMWTVNPTPGLVVKFRDPKIVQPSQKLINFGASGSKFFVNIAHCMELPSPVHDLDEDETAKLISENIKSYKLPISLGDLEIVEDKKGESATKVDVLVNSTFFYSRIEQSDFFCQLALLIICDAIEHRHAVRLDPSKQIILRNKKVIGELNAQRIRKKPKNDFKTEISNENNTNNEEMEIENTFENIPDVETLEDSLLKRPRNYKVQIIGGVFADIRIRVRDQRDNLIRDANRITFKMNDDRCVVILDHVLTITDFFLPYRLLDDQGHYEFTEENSTLIIKCPINWNLL